MNKTMEKFLTQLEAAIKTRNKKEILGVYEEINLLDFEQIDDTLLDKYDQLTEQGNDILYS